MKFVCAIFLAISGPAFYLYGDRWPTFVQLAILVLSLLASLFLLS